MMIEEVRKNLSEQFEQQLVSLFGEEYCISAALLPSSTRFHACWVVNHVFHEATGSLRMVTESISDSILDYQIEDMHDALTVPF